MLTTKSFGVMPTLAILAFCVGLLMGCRPSFEMLVPTGEPSAFEADETMIPLITPTSTLLVENQQPTGVIAPPNPTEVGSINLPLIVMDGYGRTKYVCNIALEICDLIGKVGDEVLSVTWSPNGTFLAYGFERRDNDPATGLGIWNFQTDPLEYIEIVISTELSNRDPMFAGSDVRDIWWSPNSEWLLFTHKGIPMRLDITETGYQIAEFDLPAVNEFDFLSFDSSALGPIAPNTDRVLMVFYGEHPMPESSHPEATCAADSLLIWDAPEAAWVHVSWPEPLACNGGVFPRAHAAWNVNGDSLFILNVGFSRSRLWEYTFSSQEWALHFSRSHFDGKWDRLEYEAASNLLALISQVSGNELFEGKVQIEIYGQNEDGEFELIADFAPTGLTPGKWLVIDGEPYFTVATEEGNRPLVYLASPFSVDEWVPVPLPEGVLVELGFPGDLILSSGWRSSFSPFSWQPRP